MNGNAPVTFDDLDDILQSHMQGVAQLVRKEVKESLQRLHDADELHAADMRKIMRDLYGEEPLNQGVIVTVKEARDVIERVRVAASIVRWVAPIIGTGGIVWVINGLSALGVIPQ